MSSSKKLFIATTLVATGYGVAALFGAPDPRLWRGTLAQADSVPSRTSTSSTAPENALIGPAKVGSVRLLPDAHAVAVSDHAEAASVTPELLTPTSPRELAGTFSHREDRPRASQTAMPRLMSRLAPHARLKNEAPRPLPLADRPEPTRSLRQVDATNYEQQLASRPLAAVRDAMSAEFVSETIPSPSASTSSTTTAMPLPSTQLAAPPADVTPPPWPVAEEEPLRSHVIVDGDSLAKLAGRYLDDSRRSDEIFALNRGVLSDPDILPIGLEIKIPSRGSSSPITATGPLSRKFGRPTLHATPQSGLVPVRLPRTSGVAPRARLLPPTPLE